MRIQVLCEFPLSEEFAIDMMRLPARYELMEGGDLFNRIHKPEAKEKKGRHLLDFLKSSAFTIPHFSSG